MSKLRGPTIEMGLYLRYFIMRFQWLFREGGIVNIDLTNSFFSFFLKENLYRCN